MYSEVHYSTLKYSIIQCRKVWYSILNYNVQYSRVHYSSVPYITVECDIHALLYDKTCSGEILTVHQIMFYDPLLNMTSWGWAVPSSGQALTCQAVILSLINKNSLVLVRLFLMYLFLKVLLWRSPLLLANHTTLAYSKFPKIILLTIYQLSTGHIYGQAWSLISRMGGWWVGLVIIRLKANSVPLYLPTGTELDNGCIPFMLIWQSWDMKSKKMLTW